MSGALTRIATPENEKTLLQWGLNGTVHQVEEVVRKYRRVLEVVPIPAIQPGSPAVVLPDLGMVFVGGDGGAAGIQVGAPEIVFVRSDGSGELLP